MTIKGVTLHSRSPCGERGLKFQSLGLITIAYKSLPVRGAWIEIQDAQGHIDITIASLPVRGAWIEIIT